MKLIDFGLSKRFSPGDFAKTKVREGGRGRRTVQLVLWTEKPNCRLWNEGRQAGRQAGRQEARKEGRKEGRCFRGRCLAISAGRNSLLRGP